MHVTNFNTSITKLLYYSAASLVHLPRMDSFARRIERQRAKKLDCPEIPRDWTDMTVHDCLKTTAAGEEFLIDEKRLNPEREDSPMVLGFASPNAIDGMK